MPGCSRSLALGSCSTAHAAHADRVVALAPLSTLGAEDNSAATKKLTGQIEAAIAALPGTKVVSAAQVADAIEKAKKPQLKACEGDAACLAELGKLVGAQLVDRPARSAGSATRKVVYLGATDVGDGQGAALDDARGRHQGRCAAARTAPRSACSIPTRYRGTCTSRFDVTGATVYVNGTKVALSARTSSTLPVGTQAVRVTHPRVSRLRAVHRRQLRQDHRGRRRRCSSTRSSSTTSRASRPTATRIEYIDPPLWRRWYVVGPGDVGRRSAIVAAIVGRAMHRRTSLPDATTAVARSAAPDTVLAQPT